MTCPEKDTTGQFRHQNQRATALKTNDRRAAGRSGNVAGAGRYRDNVRLFDRLVAYLGANGTLANSAPLVTALQSPGAPHQQLTMAPFANTGALVAEQYHPRPPDPARRPPLMWAPVGCVRRRREAIPARSGAGATMNFHYYRVSTTRRWYAYRLRSLGSRESRRALPSRLKPNIVIKIARPGKLTSQGAVRI